LLLKAITSALEPRTEPYLTLDEVYSEYQVACEEYGRDCEERSKIQAYLKDLEVRGYILLVKANGETLVGMEFPPDRLAKALKESLRQESKSAEA
jgi:Cdc6-like AAA superfamily ATPase